MLTFNLTYEYEADHERPEIIIKSHIAYFIMSEYKIGILFKLEIVR